MSNKIATQNRLFIYFILDSDSLEVFDLFRGIQVGGNVQAKVKGSVTMPGEIIINNINNCEDIKENERDERRKLR